jgi:hypothetical protein
VKINEKKIDKKNIDGKPLYFINQLNFYIRDNLIINLNIMKNKNYLLTLIND